MVSKTWARMTDIPEDQYYRLWGLSFTMGATGGVLAIPERLTEVSVPRHRASHSWPILLLSCANQISEGWGTPAHGSGKSVAR